MKKTTIILSIILMTILSQLASAQYNSFVSNKFKVPGKFENEHLRIRMLTINDVAKDYDAVMTSIDHLQGVFGPNSKWPSKDLTFEQDLIDLGWHQKEFQMRSSFAYTVVKLDESEVIGCIYIFPTTKGDYNAEVTMWVRSSVLKDGLDSILFDTVKQWMIDVWPFKNIAYPGRDIAWEQWNSIK